jgi:hypothetical protein
VRTGHTNNDQDVIDQLVSTVEGRAPLLRRPTGARIGKGRSGFGYRAFRVPIPLVMHYDSVMAKKKVDGVPASDAMIETCRKEAEAKCPLG